MFWALPLLWIWARRESTGGSRLSSEKKGLVLCGVLFAGDLLFWHWSIHRTSVANATLFANFAPLVVTMGAWLVLKEHISRSFLFGMLLAIFGAALLAGASFTIDRRHLVGDGLGLITALFFGSYVIAMASLRRRVQPGWIMLCSSVVTALILLLATQIAGESLIPRTWAGFATLVALAWVSQVAGQGLIAYALGHVPAAFSSLVILIEPLSAALFGWLILREPITAWQWGGGAAILAGILVSRRRAA